MMVSSSPYQVLQLEQVQDKATELSVNIMMVRSVGSSKDTVGTLNDDLGYLSDLLMQVFSCLVIRVRH